MPDFDLTPDQIRKMADICADIGQVSLGAIVVPFLLQTSDWRFALGGFILSCAGWATSIYSVKKTSYGGIQYY